MVCGRSSACLVCARPDIPTARNDGEVGVPDGSQPARVPYPVGEKRAHHRPDPDDEVKGKQRGCTRYKDCDNDRRRVVHLHPVLAEWLWSGLYPDPGTRQRYVSGRN